MKRHLQILPAILLLGLIRNVVAGQAPHLAESPDIPISSHDRVYTGDQTSNTVSVYDPSSNRLLGVLRLGDVTPQNLSPLYRAQLLVHGLGFSFDQNSGHRLDRFELRDFPGHGNKRNQAYHLCRQAASRAVFYARRQRTRGDGPRRRLRVRDR
jgi:hypothetical protein